MTFIILRNETDGDEAEWVRACVARGVAYLVVDLTRNDWLDRIRSQTFDMLLARPPGTMGAFKQLYDERLYVLVHVLGFPVYPTWEEVAVYENKRLLAYWLQAHEIPHPETQVLYHLEEARAFADGARYPVVGKTAIGAGGSGVSILRSRDALLGYVERAFGEGITRTWGPNLRKSNLRKRFLRRLCSPLETIRYFRRKRRWATSEPQRGYVILQEYIPCEFEWRCVRIGESYFGHKKLRRHGEMISGSSGVSWDVPSEPLLDFIEAVGVKSGFLSQAIDIFEAPDGRFLVNELQCFFGSKNPHQMIRDGIPGRFVRRNGRWTYEEGTFNTNNSYDLRLDHAIRLVAARRGAL